MIRLSSEDWNPLVMMSGGGFLQLVSLFIYFRNSACRSLEIVSMLSVAKPSASSFAACFPVYVFPFSSITVHPLCVVSFSSFSDFVSFRAGRSSEVERSLMVRWVVGSILHGVDPLSYFSFQPVIHDWCNKGRGMCYPVCGMVHIKDPLLLIDKSSLCGGSGFPFSLSKWSLTICLTPYNRR